MSTKLIITLIIVAILSAILGWIAPIRTESTEDRKKRLKK